ncbi:COP9 CSN3 signalosome subunit 3 [Teratosphaeria destructans]|uniref:COP9 CSN3 signalosome subunit 3 n=1 Tax=Teratosphaeria destructans TaxID=418781 RepID=A0A9W7W5C7_9PEZI|nr:COP9 CSN3 signalosome subunit 3 [Teratosphaeria destructans]
MADTLQLALSFTPDNKPKSPKDYDKEINDYIKALDKLPETAWTKQVDKKNLLELLDPSENSIPYLYALISNAKLATKNKQLNELILNETLVYFTLFDPMQIRYVGERWLSLLEWALEQLQGQSLPNLAPIAQAWLRLDPTAGTFTTFHLHFLRVCLDNSVPSQALPILDKNIYAFPTTPQKGTVELRSEEHDLSNVFITPKSGFSGEVKIDAVLHYYLLGAFVYIGQRNWSRARLFLEYILLTPTTQHTTSAIQVEAYKKWVLVGLLAEGKTFPLPRTLDQGVVKSLRAVAKIYDALSDDFEKRDHRKFQAEVDHGMADIQADGNLALVAEASKALLRFRVQDLQKTYAALPLSRVATYLGFEEDFTLRIVTDYIREGLINASITPAATSGEAVLRFHSMSSGPSSTTTQDHDLEAQTKRIEDLVTFIRDADRRLQLTKEYVDHQKRAKRSGGPDGDIADQMDLTWDQMGGMDDGDEDIMA